LNGLKPHVHVVPCSLEIVTEVTEELLRALLPDAFPKLAQVVATRPTSSARINTRLMIDSFPVVLRPS